MNKLDSAVVKMAALLLLQEGELTISDIQALPLVDDAETARAIADSLVQRFDAEWDQRKSSASGITRWEDFIRLRATREGFEQILRTVSRPLREYQSDEEMLETLE